MGCMSALGSNLPHRMATAPSPRHKLLPCKGRRRGGRGGAWGWAGGRVVDGRR
jgi:hypothetical protein